VGWLSEAQAYTSCEPEATLSLFYKIDGIHYSMFDLPEADKCLLASGELDVRPARNALKPV